MGAALREAWLWLLLAFALGLVIGYFLKARMVRDRNTADSATADSASDAATTDASASKTAAVGVAVRAASAPAALATPVATATAKVPAATKKAATKKTSTRKPAAKTATRSKPAAKAAVLDLVAAKTAVGATVKLDDLKLIDGIGPRIESLFKADGIATWRDLSRANVERLQGVLDAAGPRYKMQNPASWPRQAGLLADGKWAEFKTLTDKLKGGR